MNPYPRLKPRTPFIPTIIEALKNPGKDHAAMEFRNRLGEKLAKRMIDAWEALPNHAKQSRYHTGVHRDVEGTLDVRLATLSKLHTAARKQLVRERRKLVKAEVSQMAKAGLAAYVPSKDSILASEVWRHWTERTGGHGCRCEKPQEEPPPEQPKKFGLRTTKLKCYNQTETGHDEVYLVSVAVDGLGHVITRLSPLWSVDDDDDDVLYPSHWIYPMQDAGGFLDIALDLWEDDGGYEDVGQSLMALGGAVSIVSLGAGAALAIIGGAVSLISSLDDDDQYGTTTLNWGSKSQLEAGVGTYIKSYYGEDHTGDWFDIDLSVTLSSA